MDIEVNQENYAACPPDQSFAGEPAGRLYYRLDVTDRIVEVGGAWNEFALANNGTAIVKERVLGSSVFSHVSGDVSVMFLRTLLASARILNRPSTRAYRCDSPACKRFMEMTVIPEGDGSLMLEHRQVRTEVLPQPFVFTASQARSCRVIRCSMCNRLKTSGAWREPEFAHAEGSVSGTHGNPVIYGVCPTCLDSVRLR